MREWWANVFPCTDGGVTLGTAHTTRDGTLLSPYRQSIRMWVRPTFRIHVRPKPEGAPKRYRDDAERYAWESAARRGETPRYA